MPTTPALATMTKPNGQVTMTSDDDASTDSFQLPPGALVLTDEEMMEHGLALAKLTRKQNKSAKSQIGRIIVIDMVHLLPYWLSSGLIFKPQDMNKPGCHLIS